MTSGFFKGLLAGGILGVVFSSYPLTPQKKKMVKKRLKGQSKFFKTRANKVLKNVMEDVNDLIK